MIVGVVGFISSGKGTVGELFCENGFIKDSFAKPVKDAVSVMFGWPRDLLEGDTEYSRTWREEPDIFWSEKFGRKFSPREALQLMGTEAGRETFHPDLWVISLLNRSKGKDVVITDVRFKNEIQHIHENNGIIVRVKRGPDPDWFDMLSSERDEFYREQIMKGRKVHKSEWDWVGCDSDYVIENDGTINQLRKKVEEVLQKIK